MGEQSQEALKLNQVFAWNAVLTVQPAIGFLKKSKPAIRRITHARGRLENNPDFLKFLVSKCQSFERYAGELNAEILKKQQKIEKLMALNLKLVEEKNEMLEREKAGEEKKAARAKLDLPAPPQVSRGGS